MRFWVFLLLLPSLLTSGCTAMLQEKTEWRCFPADRNHVSMFEANRQKDFLVVYDEHSERRNKDRFRAYYLLRNQDKIAKDSRPDFVSLKLTNGLPVIPVTGLSDALTNVSSGVSVMLTDYRSFTIYSNQVPMLNGTLPMYPDPMGFRERLFASPVTITVDIALLAAAVAAISYGYTHPHQVGLR
ncbi:MAG TPA: hypothetical protein VN625_07715 [Desulfuromonadaceae bacterium]|nr:hypothetical protein [Desulfuromonadaceae bacterium]